MLWGTDSIWYGSPQDQIDAFRAFQISPELREKYGYAELTPALKRKVFGLNAVKVYSLDAGGAEKTPLAADTIDRARAAYAGAEDPLFATYGPKTRAGVARPRADPGSSRQQARRQSVSGARRPRVNIALRFDPQGIPTRGRTRPDQLRRTAVHQQGISADAPGSPRDARQALRLAAARRSRPAACWNWAARAATT